MARLALDSMAQRGPADRGGQALGASAPTPSWSTASPSWQRDSC